MAGKPKRNKKTFKYSMRLQKANPHGRDGITSPRTAEKKKNLSRAIWIRCFCGICQLECNSPTMRNHWHHASKPSFKREDDQCSAWSISFVCCSAPAPKRFVATPRFNAAIQWLKRPQLMISFEEPVFGTWVWKVSLEVEERRRRKPPSTCITPSQDHCELG